MDAKLEYQGTKLPTSNFIFFCLKGFYPDFELPEYDLILDKRTVESKVIVDEYIPLIVIQQILSIPNVIVLEAGEGRNDLQPTYLIIQLKIDSKEKINEFIKILNENTNIKANFEFDNDNMIHRIGITTNLFLRKNPEKYKVWWEELPVIISNSIQKIN